MTLDDLMDLLQGLEPPVAIRAHHPFSDESLTDMDIEAQDWSITIMIAGQSVRLALDEYELPVESLSEAAAVVKSLHGKRYLVRVARDILGERVEVVFDAGLESSRRVKGALHPWEEAAIQRDG